MVKGRKDDTGKARYDLIPVNALREVAGVLGYGCRRYGANNWRSVPGARARYTAAALRHFEAWRGGEIKDPESGYPHLAHVVCNVLFLLWFDRRRHK